MSCFTVITDELLEKKSDITSSHRTYPGGVVLFQYAFRSNQLSIIHGIFSLNLRDSRNLIAILSDTRNELLVLHKDDKGDSGLFTLKDLQNPLTSQRGFDLKDKGFIRIGNKEISMNRIRSLVYKYARDNAPFHYNSIQLGENDNSGPKWYDASDLNPPVTRSNEYGSGNFSSSRPTTDNFDFSNSTIP